MGWGWCRCVAGVKPVAQRGIYRHALLLVQNITACLHYLLYCCTSCIFQYNLQYTGLHEAHPAQRGGGSARDAGGLLGGAGPSRGALCMLRLLRLLCAMHLLHFPCSTWKGSCQTTQGRTPSAASVAVGLLPTFSFLPLLLPLPKAILPCWPCCPRSLHRWALWWLRIRWTTAPLFAWPSQWTAGTAARCSTLKVGEGLPLGSAFTHSTTCLPWLPCPPIISAQLCPLPCAPTPAGTGPQVFGNTNAPPAVARSAIIYSLRCLVRERRLGDVDSWRRNASSVYELVCKHNLLEEMCILKCWDSDLI